MTRPRYAGRDRLAANTITSERGGVWQDRAQCAGLPSDLFFPEAERHQMQAKRLCAGCPVIVECRDHALTKPERYGIWGGTTERERERYRRKRSRKVSA